MNTPATLAALAILAAAPQACAAISMVISDDGTNLTMVATGSYDLTNVVFAGDFSLGADAAVAPAAGGIFGWETGTASRFVAAFTGTLAGTIDVFPASTASANIPFFVEASFSRVIFVLGAPTTGTVNNTATFDGVTLASLGMVAGESITGTWGLGGADETITISTGAVPEPSALLLSALGVLPLLRRKR